MFSLCGIDINLVPELVLMSTEYVVELDVVLLLEHSYIDLAMILLLRERNVAFVIVGSTTTCISI